MKRMPLKYQLQAVEQELNDFQSLFDLQRKRTGEAVKFWQLETGESYHPDLGLLLEWLINKAKLRKSQRRQCLSCKHAIVIRTGRFPYGCLCKRTETQTEDPRDSMHETWHRCDKWETKRI